MNEDKDKSNQKNPFTLATEKQEQEGNTPTNREEQIAQKADIKRYKDIGGLTLKKLNIGLWYIEHKKSLHIALIVFLALVSAVSWSYTIYGFAYYVTRGMQEDEQLARQIVESGNVNHDAILQASPKELMFKQINILKSTDSRYDFSAQIENINERHMAEFEYYFLAGDKETNRYSGFILPKESKYLLSLSNELDFNPNNVLLKFTYFRWIRIDRHEIPDWNSYRDDRIDIKISNIEFAPVKNGDLSEVSLNHLKFTATNDTVYNYWNVDFVIILYSGFNIVGVNKYSIDEFMSSQERNTVINWPGIIGPVNKTEIVPEINILKDDIYIKFEGGIGEEK